MVGMAKPKKKPKREGDAGLSLYVESELREALDKYIEDYNASESREYKATLREAVESALRAYLKTKGYWPPQ